VTNGKDLAVDSANESSNRHRSWEVMCALLSQQTLAEERERRRLATQLHDGLCQTLNLMTLKLSLASRGVLPREAAIAEVEELIQESGRSARALMSSLSPTALYHFGLPPALHGLADKLAKSHGLAVQVRDDGQPLAIPEEAMVLLFRAVQELLLNVARHAKVPSASVSLRRDGQSLAVIVQDGGVGFDAAATMAGGKSRLLGLQACIEYLGGHVDIRSAPGQGTTVTLTVPLSPT
jgi:signal transduction histidine kinase